MSTEEINKQWALIKELSFENKILQGKVDKLKQLLLLTDKAVSNVKMNDLTKRQWVEFIKIYPNEGGL